MAITSLAALAVGAPVGSSARITLATVGQGAGDLTLLLAAGELAGSVVAAIPASPRQVSRVQAPDPALGAGGARIDGEDLHVGGRIRCGSR